MVTQRERQPGGKQPPRRQRLTRAANHERDSDGEVHDEVEGGHDGIAPGPIGAHELRPPTSQGEECEDVRRGRQHDRVPGDEDQVGPDDYDQHGQGVAQQRCRSLLDELESLFVPLHRIDDESNEA